MGRGSLRAVANEGPASQEGSERDREKGRGENAIFDALRRLVGSGVGRIAEGPENLKHLVSELRLPRDLLSAVGEQFDDAKVEALRLVMRETKEYLASRDLAKDLVRLLTGLTLEVRTQIRFLPNPTANERPDPLVTEDTKPMQASSPPHPSTTSPEGLVSPVPPHPVSISTAPAKEKDT